MIPIQFNNPAVFAPIINGPFFEYRHAIKNKLIAKKIKPGMVLCRKGDAFLYGFIHFSQIIANVTCSPYSHAAIVLDVIDSPFGQDILVADVDRNGLNRQYISDWVSACMGNSFSVLDFTGDSDIMDRAVDEAWKYIDMDSEFDLGFDTQKDDRFYCVEFVERCYRNAGIRLSEETPINKMPGWKRWMEPLARLHGLDTNSAVYCVGNKNGLGLLSSPVLKEFCTITLKQMKKENDFKLIRGA